MGTSVRRSAVLLVTVLCGLFALVLPSLARAVPATTTTPTSPSYIQAPGTSPTVDTIQDGSSVAAPYNLSQGITSFNSLAISPYPGSDLLPTFSFGGSTTPTSTAGAISEPNVAVYPAQSGSEPFASGFAGSPGPLSGYCGTSYSDAWNTSATATTGNPNEAATPVGQPAGESLPFAPYYFPYITRNSDGTLTGYFDWRPKDADEAIVSATSSDNGRTWTATGEALEQNPGYCPSGDTNDDGLGHPYVAALGSSTDLYTLQRAIGDYAGTGLDSFPLNAGAANPLSGVRRTASVGVDPNTFATTATPVSSTAASIPVSTLGGDAANGNATSINDGTTTAAVPDPSALPNGYAQYEDLTQSTPGTQPPVITCTGTSGSNGNSPSLTGCTSPTAINVGVNDDLVEVIGTTQSVVQTGTSTAATTVPYGPQNTGQTAGVDITLNTTGTNTSANAANISANTNTLTYLLNANAPNRYYINGSTVYCVQGNAEPTKAIETCTTTNPNGVSVTGSGTTGDPASGTPIIADPVIPSAGANYSGGPVSQTNGLLSPDGIDGPLPASANAAWGEPSTGKVVLYTQKLVNYFIEGGINGTVASANAASYSNDKTAGKTAPVALSSPQTGSSSTLATGFVYTPGATPTDYNISPFPTEAEQLPTSGSFKVYVGAELGTGTNAVTGAEMDTLTCTGWDVNSNIADLYNPNLKTIDLLGCTSANATDVLNAGHQGNWVAGPGAAIESTNSSNNAILPQIGEGKAVTAKNAQKLFSNNEDYEVIRAAYTTDGLNFTDLGPISGSTSGNGSTSGRYSDITNPDQQYSPAGPSGTGFDVNNPQGVSPTNGTVGSLDQVELRWPGARGTIITNPDGTIGMFLSGAWASDGDSDAFNQIFYTQSSDGGRTWSVPRIVQSTDYTFAASAAQDASPTSALGVSAYYSGRAYDPTVVDNGNGTLTMVFAGYRLPAPVKAAGTALGTNSSALYCSGIVTSGCSTAVASNPVSETDPALYRNILTETLWPNVGTLQPPTVTTGSASAITTTGASVAGTVQTNEPQTTVSVLYGTSATSLNKSASAGTLAGSASTQNVTAGLSGLSQGTTYYYVIQATNASGTSDGTESSFTTAGTSAATTSTRTVTQTTTVTAPGAIFTVTGPTTSVPTTATASEAQFTTASSSVGNQTVSIEVPNTKLCLASSAQLKVAYQSSTGPRGTKLSFVHAALSVDGKLRSTVTRHVTSVKLALKGLKQGSHTLRVVSTYHYKVGRKTRTLTKTQNIRFKVC